METQTNLTPQLVAKPELAVKPKRCGECGGHFERNTDNFVKNRSTPDGLASVCRSCKTANVYRYDRRQHMIVYAHTCTADGSTYIGSTVQTLAVRVAEHRSDAFNKLSTQPHHQKLREYPDPSDWERTILESYPYESITKEALREREQVRIEATPPGVRLNVRAASKEYSYE